MGDDGTLEGIVTADALWEAPAEAIDWRAIIPKDCVYLFPNRLDSDRPMADRSLNALMERLGFSGDGTPHGMRATFSTHFNALGESIDVIEH